MSEANQVIEVSPSAEVAVDPRQLRGGTTSKPRTLWGDAWRRFRRHKLAMVGAVVLLLFTVAVTIGPLLYRVDREFLDFSATSASPSRAHPFGADDLGRDILARALFGGRISLLVGLVAMLVAISLGSLIGSLSGFLGGAVDQALMRLTDLFLSLPVLPLLLMTIYLFREPVMALLGPERGIFVIVVVMIGALNWMGTARIVRASFLSLKQKEFVEAATCLGVSQRAIMFRHILPNALSPIIVAATLEVGNAIITESTLSFLGVGFPPDTPTWGRLVTDGNQSLPTAPHIALIPAALIFLTVLSINFMGDGLRDALDPRSRL
jgi:peptide/nickel transport system permease protein